MAKIRVYELAKKLGLENKELVVQLQDLGIDVKSHMGVLETADLEKFESLHSAAESVEPPADVKVEEQRISSGLIRRRRSTAPAPDKEETPEPEAETAQPEVESSRQEQSIPQVPEPEPELESAAPQVAPEDQSGAVAPKSEPSAEAVDEAVSSAAEEKSEPAPVKKAPPAKKETVTRAKILGRVELPSKAPAPAERPRRPQSERPARPERPAKRAVAPGGAPVAPVPTEAPMADKEVRGGKKKKKGRADFAKEQDIENYFETGEMGVERPSEKFTSRTATNVTAREKSRPDRLKKPKLPFPKRSSARYALPMSLPSASLPSAWGSRPTT